VTRVALSIGILAILLMQSENALAACTTTGLQTAPVTLTCAANTTTTNTPNTVSPATTSDRTQDLNSSIIAQVNGGVTVDGFGLNLITTLPGSTVSVTNDGLITTNQNNGIRALQVSPGAAGNFGTFTYSGAGSISNTGSGDALNISNSGTGGISITVSGTSTIAATNTGTGIGTGSGTGAVGVTVQSGGTVQGGAGVSFGGAAGNTLTNSGTVQGIGALSVGVSATAATIINSGNITALGRGALGDNLNITNNLGGTIQATGVGGVGVQAIGAIGFANITNNTGATISATNTNGIAIATATAAVNNSGTISGAFDGVNTQNTTTLTNSGMIIGTARSGVRVGSNASIDNSGTITGLAGIVFRDAGVGFGAPTNGSVINSGTITGIGGTAINFAATPGAGPSSLTIASTSVINGNVLGTGADTFQLGSSSAGAFNVSNIGATQQYRGFATFNKIGTSTWTLTGSGAQNWTISQGTLIGDTNSLAGTSITNNAALVYSQNFDGVHSGAISGSGTLTKNGSGTVILAADNVYSGGTTISAGKLQLGNGGVTGSILGNVTDNAVFAINRSNAYTFAGIILGSGAFEQNGSGNTDLTATNSYTGTTTVNGGTLQVDGSIASSSLTTVNTSATLAGIGTVGKTTIANGGTFMPGNGTPGSSMTVAGNLAFQSGALYLVQVNPATASIANVAGTATLGGATANAIYANGSYVAKKYTILTATGGVSGTFASLVNTNLPSSVSASLSYDAHDVFLNLTLNLSVPGSLNGNQQNVANALTNFFNANGGIPGAFAVLSPAGLTQAAGETATGSQQTTFDAMHQFMGVMTDPFIAGRGDPVTSATGAPPYAEEDNGASAYAADGKPRSKSERDAYAAIYRKAQPMADPLVQRWSVWAAGFGGSQTTDGNATVGSNTATSRIFGTAVGADYRFSPFTLAGFALAGGGTNFSVNGLGTGRSDLFQAGAYVRHTAGPAYVTAALAYGWQDITTDRTVTINGVDRLRAEFNANAFSGRAEGGYRLVAPWTGGIGFTPYAAGQFVTFDLPAYAEQVVSGANTFAQTYGSKSVTDTRSELGVRTDKSFAMPDAILTLRGRAAWAHDFNPDRNIAATFQALPGASFVVNGAAQASDSALITASAEMKWLNGWSAAATFEGEFSNVTRSYAGKGVVRYAW